MAVIAKQPRPNGIRMSAIPKLIGTMMMMACFSLQFLSLARTTKSVVPGLGTSVASKKIVELMPATKMPFEMKGIVS